MRVGRYPSMRDGGPSWYGVIADTNAPDSEHWWPILAGETVLPDYLTKQEAKMLVKPDNWTFFIQPPAMHEILDKEKDDIKNIISNINEISDSLNKYTLDNSIQPFNAKPLE